MSSMSDLDDDEIKSAYIQVTNINVNGGYSSLYEPLERKYYYPKLMKLCHAHYQMNLKN